MHIKAFIFDLDGVIVFTDHYHYLAWKDLADQKGIYFDEEINHRLRGVSRMDSLEIILEKATQKYSQEEKNAMADYKNNLYRDYLETMSPSDIKSEDLKTLKELKKQGYLLAVASSSKNAQTILEKTDLAYLFDEVVDGNQIINSKPDPEVFLKAAEKLGVDPSEAIVIEDAEAGIIAASKGGFISCAFGKNLVEKNYPLHILALKELLKISVD